MKRFIQAAFLFCTIFLGSQTTILHANPAHYTDSMEESCQPPQNFMMSNMTSAGALFSWSPVPGALGYSFEAVVNGVPQTPIVTTNTSLTYLFPPGNTYQFTVRTICSDGQLSRPSNAIVFSHKDPLITIEEIGQRTSNCVLPSNTNRYTGEFDDIILDLPSNGMPDIVKFDIIDPSYGYFSANVRFLLWIASDSTLHYKTLLHPPGSVYSRNPNCGACETHFINFSLLNNPFFSIEAVRNGSSYYIRISYQTNVKVKYCLEGNGGELNGTDDRSGSLEEHLIEATALKAQPNPVQDRLQVNFQTVIPGATTLALFDMLGRPARVLEQNVFLNEGEYQHDYDVSDLPAGVYYLMLQTPTDRKMSTIIKQ